MDETKKEIYADTIIDEVGRMTSIVNELMNLLKIESATTSIEFEKIDIISLLEELRYRYDYLLEEKQLKIDVESNKEQIFIDGDRMLIEQLINNLLSNAVKYVNERGELKISIDDNFDNVVFKVYNSGNEIPKKYLKKIWDPFYKVDKSRNRKNNGTGLGLAIVRRIMERHEGEYFVENKNNGVEFGVVFKKRI